jgi:hypothetical protein
MPYPPAETVNHHLMRAGEFQTGTLGSFQALPQIVCCQQLVMARGSEAIEPLIPTPFSSRHPEDRRTRSRAKRQHTAAEQPEPSTTVHLALDELQTMDLALDLSVVPRQFDGREDGGTVPFQAITESFQFGQSEAIASAVQVWKFPVRRSRSSVLNPFTSRFMVAISGEEAVNFLSSAC